MTTERRSACILLTLPDERVVFQRRTDDAPTSPNKLGVFGGGVEAGETDREAAERELGEETDLKLAGVAIRHLGNYKTWDTDHGSEIVSLFEADVPSARFEVYEGKGAEVYALNRAMQRDDMVLTLRWALEHHIQLRREEENQCINQLT